jgi:Holliday junction resolvase RusA-like endonuclease
MSSRSTLHYPEGTTDFGTATLREPGYAQKELARRGNPVIAEPDAFDLITRPEPVFTRSVQFTVFGTPVAKGRPRAFRSPTGIGMHTPAKTKKYETSVKAAASEAMRGSIPFGRPVRLTLAIVLPIPKSWTKHRQTLARIGCIAATNKPDADNVLKAIKDGMNEIVYEDDAQVVSMAIEKKYGEVPHVAVFVEEIDKEAA